MPRKKDNIEMDLAAIIKTARTSIRLRHSLAADAEINERIPEIEKEYMTAVATGKKFSLKALEL